MSKNEKIVEYDVMRVFVTVLVVIGHCGYYSISSQYGGCDYSTYAQNLSLPYKCFNLLVNIIYSFHMPLFMALSGALLRVSNVNGKYLTFKSLADSKFKRLMIPFFAVTVLFSVPLKLLVGYFNDGKSFWADLIVGELLLQGNSYLWFLCTLFLIFIFFFVCTNVFKIKYQYLLFIYIPLHFIGQLINIHILSYVCIYSVWFLLGYIFEDKRKSINKHINMKIFLGVFVLFIILFLVNREINSRYIKYILKFFVSFTGVASCYILCECLKNSKITDLKFYNIVKNNSFGIYLYSDPLNYVILYFSALIFENSVYASFSISCVYIAVRIMLNFLISILITMAIRKTKIKYLT